MRVCFIRPPADGLVSRAGRRYNRVWPPLDILNCAAIARAAGAEVDVIDLLASDGGVDDLARRTASSDLIFVTTSALDRWQCPSLDITGILGFIRTLPLERVYVMGAHGSVNSEWVLVETGAKAVVRGEPEGPVSSLVSGSVLEETEGISTFMAGGDLVENPVGAPCDLRSLPLPAYDLVDIGNYMYELLGPRIALLETARGCPYPCVFCFKNAMYGKGVRVKSLDQVSREINDVVCNHGASSIYFFDLEFGLAEDMTRHVCKVVSALPRKIKWCCQTRVDVLDETMIREMAESGCRLIHLGVESGNERVLDLIRKRIDVAAVTNTVGACRRSGIETACFFTLGFPGESREEMTDTIEFAKFLDPTYASFHIATPYSGTGLEEFALEGDVFPRYCKTELDPEELERMVRGAYRSFYMRPGYLARRIFTAGPCEWIRLARMFFGYAR